MKEPLLGTATGAFLGHKACHMNVHGGLDYIKGNRLPHFSLTADILKGVHDIGGGCMHDDILKWFPHLRPLAALHLCDIYGEPMHAVANGLYDLAGAVTGHFAERYHRGNSPQNFPATPPPDKPWMNYEHRLPTADECLAMFADRYRIEAVEAERIRSECITAFTTACGAGDSFSSMEGCDEPTVKPEGRAAVLAALSAEVERLRPIWKAEADECIAKLNLRVYGDRWEHDLEHPAQVNRRKREESLKQTQKHI